MHGEGPGFYRTHQEYVEGRECATSPRAGCVVGLKVPTREEGKPRPIYKVTHMDGYNLPLT